MIEPTRSGFLEDGDERVFWEYHGDGDAPAVVLLNGLAMHTKAWYGFLDELRPDFDVLLYDYLGQGESSSPDEVITFERLASHLDGILELLEIERVHVMGISYGGFVAMEFARLHPDRLLTVTLSGILASHERQFEMYQEMSLRFYSGGPALFELYTHYLYEKIFGEAFLRSVSADDLESMRRRFDERYRHRIHSLVRLTEAQIPFFDGLEDRVAGYGRVEAPVLVLAGAEDRCIPVPAQEKLASIFPHSRFEKIAGAGHVVYLERRRPFFETLRAFMAAKRLDIELSLGPTLPAR